MLSNKLIFYLDIICSVVSLNRNLDIDLIFIQAIEETTATLPLPTLIYVENRQVTLKQTLHNFFSDPLFWLNVHGMDMAVFK